MLSHKQEHINLNVITCVVQRGKSEAPLKAAMDAGAQGATVYFARGTGIREKLGTYGVGIQPEKEVITIVTTAELTDKVFNALVQAGKLDQPGQGFAYVQSVNRVIGFIE